MRAAITTLAIALLAGCATPMSDKAAKIQVHSQMSTLLSACKNLGPVSGSAGGWGMAYQSAPDDAKAKAREAVADKGGDTLVVTNTDGNGYGMVMQGVALRCY